uniref:Uncharacterized protein n=1 Tax=Panagrolaimus superbus TaxID=310955 RepID=A0A914Z2R6_9BILA
MKELKMLTKSGNVEHLEVYEQIYFYDGTKLAPETLVALLPKLSRIFLNAYTITEETMKNLIKLEHPKQLSRIIWYRIEEEINVNLLCQFLEKHHEPGGIFRAWFSDDDYNERFGKEICEKMEKWEPKTRKPSNFPEINMPN